jgi:hypothetical protein
VADYTAKIVEEDGTVLAASVPGINIGVLQWVLSEMGRTAVRVPAASLVAGDLDLLDKEIQIFRNGDIIWWGPLIVDEVASNTAEKRIDVPDKAWYFQTRQISDQRDNRFDNPNFALGTASWTNVGTSAHSASVLHSARGGTSLKLTQATPGEDTFDFQQQTFTAGEIGTWIIVRAWVYIDDATWGGPAFEARGLFVSGIEAGVVKDYRYAEIDDATPRNALVPLTTRIWIPPLKTWTIEARPYAPAGESYWSAMQMVKMESLSHYATDLGAIIGSAVQFVQNPAHGWDDLNIGVSNAVTGVVLDWHFQYADHTDLMEVLDAAEAMGLDWSIEVTETTATFTTYFPKGTDRSSGPGAVTLSMFDRDTNPTGNLSHAEMVRDGASTRTRSTVLGEGDGPEREEGFAVDTTLTGGRVLGEVFSAPPGTPIEALDRIAAQRVAAKRKPVRVMQVVGLPGDETLITTCVVGDTVAADITIGETTITGNWRIVAKNLDPKRDLPSFVLNEAA